MTSLPPDLGPVKVCWCGRPLHARGLCDRHYTKSLRYGAIKDYPRVNHSHPYPETGDPHIIWFFKEMQAQGRTMDSVVREAGFSNSLIQRMKNQQQIGLVAFKNFLEVLGYEIKIVGKEPKDGKISNVD